MDDNAKKNEVVAIACTEAGEVLKQVLGETIAEHYSQRDWENIAVSFMMRMRHHLAGSFKLSQALCQSDLYTPDRRINMEAVIEAFKQATERIESPAHKAQLAFLTQHLEHSYEGLRSAFRRSA
jgi:hypothetical protein